MVCLKIVRNKRIIDRYKRDNRKSLYDNLRDIIYSTYISTRSTLTPQGSVASSSEACIVCEMVSRSARISAKLLVPKTVRNVLAASSRVEWLERGVRSAMRSACEARK